MMKKVMVVGGAGVLGILICQELFRIFQGKIRLVITDYNVDRGKRKAATINNNVEFRYLDVTKEESIQAAIQNVDSVIVVLKQQQPHIQRVCIENRITCIDVTPFTDFVEKVKCFHPDAVKNDVASVVMSGFFPGLSGLMVKKAVSQFQKIDEVNIGLLQNTNAKAGVTGILDMLKIISERVDDPTGENVSGFTKKRKMYFLDLCNQREVRLIHHAEANFLKQSLTIENIHYWTAWNAPVFNKQISLMKRLGIIHRVLKLKKSKFLSKVVKHNPEKSEDAYLTVKVKGTINVKQSTKTLTLSTFSDYHTTASITAAIAKLIAAKKLKGVTFPFEIIDLDELLSVINYEDIIIEES